MPHYKSYGTTKTMSRSWDIHFIKMAKLNATKSKDRSTKVGVIVAGEDNEVLSAGFNGFPRAIDDAREDYHERPMKYKVTEHAERNAIYNAARQGIRLKGATMYFDGDPYPCSDCARAVIQAGIKRVVGTNEKFEGKRLDANGTNFWEADCAIGKDLLEQAGVEIVVLDKGEIV